MFCSRFLKTRCEGSGEFLVKSCPYRTLVSFGLLDPNLAWKHSGSHWGGNGLRNTVVVNRVRIPIIRIILQKVAFLFAFGCCLDVSFRQDDMVSSMFIVASVRTSSSFLGGIFSLPVTATQRAFSIAHRRSQYGVSFRLWGLARIYW